MFFYQAALSLVAPAAILLLSLGWLWCSLIGLIFHWGADGPHVGCSFIGVIFHWGADGPHVGYSLIGVIFHWGADGPHVGCLSLG